MCVGIYWSCVIRNAMERNGSLLGGEVLCQVEVETECRMGWDGMGCVCWNGCQLVVGGLGWS